GTAKRELAKENFARFLKVYENSQDIRRLGSAALELAYTACGRQDGYFEVYLNPWDYAAGMLLVQEAGGKVSDWKGRILDPAQGSQVVGTNGQIHEELLKLLL
ncbi:MAG TPA: inositol monophosphatase, partial [Candidatus Bacteroides merdipullorum]|nr:inositol monophosphatase [Candidatus Bacteroides merdipullorum]